MVVTDEDVDALDKRLDADELTELIELNELACDANPDCEVDNEGLTLFCSFGGSITDDDPCFASFGAKPRPIEGPTPNPYCRVCW